MKKAKKTDANSLQQSSAAIETLFADAITRVKTQAAQEIAKQTANSEAQAQQEVATIKLASDVAIARAKAKASEAVERTIKVRTEAEENAKALADMIAQLKAELIEKEKVHKDQVVDIKAEAEELIANTKAVYEQQITSLKTKSEVTVAEAKAIAIDIAEQLAKVETEAEEKQKAYEEQLARAKSQAEEETEKVKAQAEEKIKELTEQVTQIKTQAEEKQKAYEEQIDKIKAEADEAIAQQKADSESQTSDKEKDYGEQIAKLKAKADKKVKDLTEQIAQINIQTEESQNAHEEQIAKLKAEVAEKQKAVAITESKKLAQSPADLPDGRSLTALAIYAKDIMQKELVWGNPEGSVQDAIRKMEQHNIRYLLIGSDGVLEGVVSKTDLAGALSPYLRPEFAKWRRPLDDATLQLKVKWIMSRPVHIIRPQTPLATIMRNMSRLRVCALPVVDQQGKVLGLVTEVDVFKAILKPESDSTVSNSDKPHQVQSVFPKPSERTRTQPTKTNQPSLVSA